MHAARSTTVWQPGGKCYGLYCVLAADMVHLVAKKSRSRGLLLIGSPIAEHLLGHSLQAIVRLLQAARLQQRITHEGVSSNVLVAEEDTATMWNPGGDRISCWRD